MSTIWNGEGLDLFSNNTANWTNGVPSLINPPVFDGVTGGNPTKDCVWNTLAVPSFTVNPAYTGKITQQSGIIITCTNAFLFDSTGNSTAEFIQSTDGMYVGGKFTDIGSGLGVTNNNNTPLYLAGDCEVNRSSSSTINRFEGVIFIGSLYNENTANTRTIDWPAGKSQLARCVIRSNQTFTVVDTTQINIVAGSGDNITWQDDGSTVGLAIAGFWAGLQNMTFISTAINRFQIDFHIANIIGANFGNSRVTINDNGSLYGHWITGGFFRFRNSGIQAIASEAGCIIQCGDFQIGHETNPSRQTNFTQKAGSTIICNNNVTVNQDNTIVTSQWLREDGSNVYIGGRLLVEADASLEWDAVTTSTSVGAVDFNGSSNVNVDNSLLDIIGDGTDQSKNPSNGNRDIFTHVTDNANLNISGNYYSDGFKGPNSGNGLVTGGGQILSAPIQNLENLTFIANSDGGIDISTASGSGNPTAGDYGNCDINLSVDGAEFTPGVNSLKAYRLNVFRLTGGSTTDGTIGYDIDAEIEFIKITDTTLNSRRGRLFWASSGTLIVNQGFVINDADIPDVSSFIALPGSGPIISNVPVDAQVGTVFDNQGAESIYIDGDFIPLGTANIGPSPITHTGDFDLSNTTVPPTSSGATLIKRGANDTVLDLNGLTDMSVAFEQDSGGIVRPVPFLITGNIREAAYGDNDVIWQAGGNYAANHIQTLGSTNAKTSNKSSAASSYQITVAELGPINYHSGWEWCNIVGAYVRVDTDTGSDDGNNDVTPPDGLDFGSFPRDRVGLGMGPGRKILGGGEIAPNITKDKLVK